LRTEPHPSDARKRLISADPSATELIDALLTGRSVFLAQAITRIVRTEAAADLDRAIDLLERLADVDLDGDAR